MITIIIVFILVASLGLLYWFPVRHWFNQWGTTKQEVTGVMPGDKVIAYPTNSAMQAVTIATTPENIWPWLVQMGYKRGGLYSYDWLDRLFGFLDRPSTKNILPQFQHLSVGDKIPWGHGEYLTVKEIEPPDLNPANHSLVYSYNTNYLISHVKRNTTDLEDTGSAVTIDYAYDNANIIKSVTYTYSSGSPEVEAITKSSRSSDGYALSTRDEGDFGQDNLTAYNFDANGRFVSWASYTVPATVPNMHDSLIYDASGNISKVVQTDTSYWTGGPETINFFQIDSRATKGNEFATLNKVLFNGVSQLPEFTFSNSAIGSLLNNIDDWYFYQFTAYPPLSVTVYQESTNSYVTFNPNPQFDSKNRIVSFTMYNGDGDFYYETVNLTYYK